MNFFARIRVGLAMFLLGVVAGGLAVSLRQYYLADPLLNIKPPRRLEATVFLPLYNNRREKFSGEQWDAAVNLLVHEFGGATLGPPMEGCWRDSKGELQKEPIRPVIVSFEPARLGQFRQKVKEVGRTLGQEEVYTRFEEPRVELLLVE
jgi:hypothetical protein